METNGKRERVSGDAKRKAAGIGALLLVLGVIGMSISMSLAYVPKVTKVDILAGGGSCIGSLCTINKTSWFCAGSGNCTRIVF